MIDAEMYGMMFNAKDRHAHGAAGEHVEHAEHALRLAERIGKASDVDARQRDVVVPRR